MKYTAGCQDRSFSVPGHTKPCSFKGVRYKDPRGSHVPVQWQMAGLLTVLGLLCLGLEVGGIECVSWCCSSLIERPPVAWTLQFPSRSQLGLEKATYWEV